jgi:hypothetical protein
MATTGYGIIIKIQNIQINGATTKQNDETTDKYIFKILCRKHTRRKKLT